MESPAAHDGSRAHDDFHTWAKPKGEAGPLTVHWGRPFDPRSYLVRAPQIMLRYVRASDLNETLIHIA